MTTETATNIPRHPLSVFVQVAAMHNCEIAPDGTIQAGYTTYPVTRITQRSGKIKAGQPPAASRLDISVIVPDQEVLSAYYPHERSVPIALLKAMKDYAVKHDRLLLIATPGIDDEIRMIAAEAAQHGRPEQGVFTLNLQMTPTFSELVHGATLVRILADSTPAARIGRANRKAVR